jgi:hypothetical protein
MYYVIHVLVKGDNGNYQHIPFYFGFTQDKQDAERKFDATCKQLFSKEANRPIIGEANPNTFCVIKFARGKVEKKGSLKGFYMVQLCETYFPPDHPSISLL